MTLETSTKQSFDSIFAPKSVAVVGASNNTSSVGGSIFSNLFLSEFPGQIFAVNRKREEIRGQIAYGSVLELPLVPDLVVICTPSATVPAIVRECGEKGVGGVIVISAGFREAGAEGRKLELDLIATRKEFPGLRFIGPNCLGILRPVQRLNASFSPVMPKPGRLTFLSQSGALCTAILDWSIDREIGFATCVSVGNMADVGMGDLIDYFAEDDQTDALLLYVEGLADAEHFLSAAKACSRRKPVIAYKAGRFAESSAAAASHTGAIASADAIYDVAFRHAGIERVNSIEELFDCARLLTGQPHALGDRLAIVTNAGGPGVMASDAWLALHSPLAKLSEDSLAALCKSLPSCWSHGNPIDVLGDATDERFRMAIDIASKDPNVDAVLVILTPQTMTEPTRIAERVVEVSKNSNKPIVASWIGGPAVRGGRDVLRNGNVPAYDFPEEAIHALKHLVSAGRLQRKSQSDQNPAIELIDGRHDRPSKIISSDSLERWRAEVAAANGLLGEVRSKALLAEYGIPTVLTEVAHTADEAVAVSDRLGYPVVLKILSQDISHKTDVGGVALNLANADSVRSSFSQMIKVVRERCPNAQIEGVAVQQMISATRGVELLLGMTRDRQFGPVILLGAGGVTAELQKDSVLELSPFDDQVVDRMLRSLRLYPTLEGYRGRPGIHLGKLKDAILRFATMTQEIPELATAEINPLLATPDSVVALDARMISSDSSFNP